MRRKPGALAGSLALLIVASAALFAVGVAVERSEPNHESTESHARRATEGKTATTTLPARESGEAGESPTERVSEDTTASAPSAADSGEQGGSSAERAAEGRTATSAGHGAR
jgi:hypothetical protein